MAKGHKYETVDAKVTLRNATRMIAEKYRENAEYQSRNAIRLAWGISGWEKEIADESKAVSPAAAVKQKTKRITRESLSSKTPEVRTSWIDIATQKSPADVARS